MRHQRWWRRQSRVGGPVSGLASYARLGCQEIFFLRLFIKTFWAMDGHFSTPPCFSFLQTFSANQLQLHLPKICALPPSCALHDLLHGNEYSVSSHTSTKLPRSSMPSPSRAPPPPDIPSPTLGRSTPVILSASPPTLSACSCLATF